MLGAGAFTENFRSALNGFNRTDVVQFIQRQTVEYEKSIRLLREENARLKAAAAEQPAIDVEALLAEKAALELQLDTLTQEHAELKNGYEALSEEKATLTASLTRAEEQLAATAKSLEDAQSRASAAETALEESRAQLASAEQSLAVATVQKADGAPATAPVGSLDLPISTPAGLVAPPSSFDELELAAYRRAEQTERMARERAAAASARIQSIFRQTEEKMTLTATDMNLLLDNMNASYAQMKLLMENARNILAESNEGLKVSSDLSSLV